MPFDRKLYPADWEDRRARILARAGHCCEFCKVPNGETKNYGQGEHEGMYMLDNGRLFSAHNGAPLGMARGSEFNLKSCTRVVLTIAHLDRTGAPGTTDGPLDCPDDRLAALCQACHLHLDRHRHQAKAAATRARKKGLVNLFP